MIRSFFGGIKRSIYSPIIRVGLIVSAVSLLTLGLPLEASAQMTNASESTSSASFYHGVSPAEKYGPNNMRFWRPVHAHTRYHATNGKVRLANAVRASTLRKYSREEEGMSLSEALGEGTFYDVECVPPVDASSYDSRFEMAVECTVRKYAVHVVARFSAFGGGPIEEGDSWGEESAGVHNPGECERLSPFKEE